MATEREMEWLLSIANELIVSSKRLSSRLSASSCQEEHDADSIVRLHLFGCLLSYGVQRDND